MKKWTIESYFEEIADNYIQARVPVLSGKIKEFTFTARFIP